MEKRFNTILFSLLVALSSQAQIGYHVSLLNSATGEPRANETVSVEVTITNSQNEQIYSGTQSATTNDFGVLSLQVGNGNTFKDVDWTKLPFYVSATIGGIMIGKSQILNVPVAEAAKTLIGDISKEELCSKTWKSPTRSLCCGTPCSYIAWYHTLSFTQDGKFTLTHYECTTTTETGIYYLQGNNIILDTEYYPMIGIYDQGNIYIPNNYGAAYFN